MVKNQWVISEASVTIKTRLMFNGKIDVSGGLFALHKQTGQEIVPFCICIWF